MAGSRGWLTACKPPECCTHAKHARSWRVAIVVAIQDKSPRLARSFARGLNSRLNPVMRSSCQNTLFGKNWLFTFLLILLYVYPYTHDFEKASRENFERETLEKNKIDSSPIFIKRLFKFSTLFLSIVKSLRGLLPKPFLTISISVRRLSGALWSN